MTGPPAHNETITLRERLAKARERPVVAGATMKEPEVTDAKWLRMFGEVLREQGKMREAILCQHYADKLDLYERHGRISGVLIAGLFFAGLFLGIAYYLK